MKTSLSLLSLSLGLGLQVIAAAAQANPALAEKSACLNCHDVSKKMVGPAFKSIAEKYKTRADAATYLAEKISKGSSGVWGNLAMPPMSQVSPADAKTLAQWIATGAN